MAWERKKLLIWGTTYPEFSKNYFETVCTGAVDAETRSLVRIYPITLRYLEQRFHHFDWIEANVEKNSSDLRPESYRIDQQSIRVVGHIGTEDGWEERRRWVLARGNEADSVEALIEEQRANGRSLAVVRPREIIDIRVEHKSEADRLEWEGHRAAALAKRDLFVDAEEATRDLVYMPVQYRIFWRCFGQACKTHNMSMLDWGTYALSRRSYATAAPLGAEHRKAAAEDAVIKKLREYLQGPNHEPFLYLGNTKAHPTSFMIVGLFYPRRVSQIPLL